MGKFHGPSKQPTKKEKYLPLLALYLLLFVTLSWTWIGFMGSDDGLYLFGARKWLTEFPFVPQHFGNVRHTVLIPIAISLGVFGESEFTLVLSTVLYYVLFIAVTYIAIGKYFGIAGASFSIFLLIITPLFAVQSTIASVDMPILFYVSCSFWSFIYSLESENKAGWLITTGVCVGLAILTRETAASLAIFYGVLFLFGFAMPRRYYFLIALGALSIAALESTYYWTFANNPLHRWELFLEGTAVKDRFVADSPGFAEDGNFRFNKLVDPLLLVLFNQEFGLSYFVGLGSAIYFYLKKPGTIQQRRIIGLFFLIAFIWFSAISIALKDLMLLARYYYVPTYFLMLSTALILWYGARSANRKTFVIIVTALVASNLLCMYLENKNPRFATKALIEYASKIDETLYVDERTFHLAKHRFAWTNEKLTEIVAGPARAGSLFFYAPQNVHSNSPLIPLDHKKMYQVQTEWAEVYRFQESERLIKFPMRLFHAKNWMPPGLYKKIVHPNPDVVVYRVPEL